MQLLVKSHMDKFIGKARKPGDVIDDEELSKVSPQVISALISQGKLTHPSVGGSAEEGLSHLHARMDKLQEQVADLIAGHAETHKLVKALHAGTKKKAKDDGGSD